jgi:hypothetical protein
VLQLSDLAVRPVGLPVLPVIVRHQLGVSEQGLPLALLRLLKQLVDLLLLLLQFRKVLCDQVGLDTERSVLLTKSCAVFPNGILTDLRELRSH